MGSEQAYTGRVISASFMVSQHATDYTMLGSVAKKIA
jgi:hypothetical protein